jgi:hypothetical protein
MKNILVFSTEGSEVNPDNSIKRLYLDVETIIVVDNEEQENFDYHSGADYTPKIGDKLYFMPNVNIPRVKLKNLILDYNIKVVKNIEDATAIFANKHSLGKMLESKWFYTIPLVNFKSCFEILKSSLDIKQVAAVETALEFYTEDIVYLDWQSLSLITNEDLKIYKSDIVNQASLAHAARSSSCVEIISTAEAKVLEFVLSKSIYSDGSLVSNLNGDDAVVIDEVVYEQLAQMFKSSDLDNTVIAMEIMANSKYKESLLYIHLLFKEHYNAIAESHTKNHVNFKALLSYLGKDNYSLESKLDTIVDSLILKGVLTEDMLNILMTKYSKQIVNHGSSRYFRVKSVTAIDQVLQIVNSNYNYTTMPDFIPIVIAEETVIGDIPAISESDLQWL